MKSISFSDFVMKDGYMSYKTNKFEICMEPCFNGCDVAVYDLNQNLLEPKVCTNVNFEGDPIDVILIREKAHKAFNEFYKKYGNISHR